MKQLGLLVLFFFAYCAAFSQPDSAHTITDNTYAKKKFLNEQMVARIGKELKKRTPIRTNSFYYDSIFRDDVLKELTWSLSNRGYYVPILTRCDSTSEIKLTLACTWDLWLSYSKRNNISQDEFREQISSKIMNEDVMYDICFYYQIDIMRTIIAHRDILQTQVGKEQSWQNLKVRDV